MKKNDVFLTFALTALESMTFFAFMPPIFHTLFIEKSKIARVTKKKEDLVF